MGKIINLLGKLALSVAISIIKLMHQGAINGAHDSPRLHSSGPIILTLSKEPWAEESD